MRNFIRKITNNTILRNSKTFYLLHLVFRYETASEIANELKQFQRVQKQA